MTARIPVWFLAWFAVGSGCTVLEYDKMAGTAWPAEVTDDCGTHDLASIWDGAGLWLDEDRDDAERELGDLDAIDAGLSITDPAHISAAEMMAMAKAWRALPEGPTDILFCRIHHVYGLVLNSYYYDSTNLIEDEWALGVMPDTTLRSMFANFYKHTGISAFPDDYLHSAAHELGHAFNLDHCDSDGSSIMTETGSLPISWCYHFSGSSIDHFENHDADVVFPGMGPFDICHKGH